MYGSTLFEEIFASAWISGRLTRSQRQALISVRSAIELSDDEKATADRLLYAIRRGWLRMTD